MLNTSRQAGRGQAGHGKRAYKGSIPAENVCIVLHKSANARESRQSPAVFVPVQNAKVCQP